MAAAPGRAIRLVMARARRSVTGSGTFDSRGHRRLTLAGTDVPAEFRYMASTRRLTGVIGRWSAVHPWTAIAAWLGIVAVLLLTGHLAGTIQVPAEETGSGQTGQAQQDVLAGIPVTGRVTQIRSPLVPAYADQVSADRHAALLQFQLTGNIVDDDARVVPARAAVQAAAAAHPQIKMAETGDGTIGKAPAGRQPPVPVAGP